MPPAPQKDNVDGRPCQQEDDPDQTHDGPAPVCGKDARLEDRRQPKRQQDEVGEELEQFVHQDGGRGARVR